MLLLCLPFVLDLARYAFEPTREKSLQPNKIRSDSNNLLGISRGKAGNQQIFYTLARRIQK